MKVFFTVNSATGEAAITVEDNGKGMGPPRPGGSGMTLIDAFALQLARRVERPTVGKGTRTTIYLPLPA